MAEGEVKAKKQNSGIRNNKHFINE